MIPIRVLIKSIKIDGTILFLNEGGDDALAIAGEVALVVYDRDIAGYKPASQPDVVAWFRPDRGAQAIAYVDSYLAMDRVEFSSY